MNSKQNIINLFLGALFCSTASNVSSMPDSPTKKRWGRLVDITNNNSNYHVTVQTSDPRGWVYFKKGKYKDQIRGDSNPSLPSLQNDALSLEDILRLDLPIPQPGWGGDERIHVRIVDSNNTLINQADIWDNGDEALLMRKSMPQGSLNTNPDLPGSPIIKDKDACSGSGPTLVCQGDIAIHVTINQDGSMSATNENYNIYYARLTGQ